MGLIEPKQLKSMNYMRITLCCSTGSIFRSLILHIMRFMGYCHIVSELVMYCRCYVNLIFIIQDEQYCYTMLVYVVGYTTIVQIYHVNISSQIVFCLKKQIIVIFAVL